MKTTITINTAGKRATAYRTTYGRDVFNGELHEKISVRNAKIFTKDLTPIETGYNFKIYKIN